MSSSSKIKIGLVSLGCAKNLVDSEVMLGSLLREGMEMAGDANDADVVIVNTCGFIEGAKQESIDAVLKANGLRDSGNCKAVIMAGCLTQRYPKELREQLPDVDAIVGLNEVPRIGEIVREVWKKVGQASSLSNQDMSKLEARSTLYWFGPAKYVPDFSAPRFRLTPKHSAYVKIAEGCNHPCTFCSIPRIRGKHRSRQMEDVLAEVRALVADGTKEINFISQDTTFYGKDLSGEKSEYRNPKSEGNSKAEIQNLKLPQSEEILRSAQNDNSKGSRLLTSAATRLVEPQAGTPVPPNSESQAGTLALPNLPTLPNLLREIQKIEGDFWVRLLYTHPFHWSDELIETIAACDKVCRYVDIPLQHINDEVLAKMRRETSGKYIRDLIRKIRAGVPDIAIRTTFIVGFPSETEAQFEELLEFIEDARFERLGIFKYSQEDHTPAGAMEEQLSNKVKKERFHRAMALQQKVSRKVMRSFVGKELRVLVEKEAEELPKELAEAGNGDLRSKDVRGRRPAHNENGRAQGLRPYTGNWWKGRSHADAPDIDGAVFVRGDVKAGEFARVRIVGATEYDLVGEVVS